MAEEDKTGTVNVEEQSSDERTAHLNQEQRTKINPFTNEPEPAAPLLIAPSPTDQRILAAPPHTEPLPDLVERAVGARGNGGVDVEQHAGPSLQEDPLPGVTPLPFAPVRQTPRRDITVIEQVNQGDNPPNDHALDASDVETRIGAEDSDYPGIDTSEWNESMQERHEAMRAGTPVQQLPEARQATWGDTGEPVNENPVLNEDAANQPSVGTTTTTGGDWATPNPSPAYNQEAVDDMTRNFGFDPPSPENVMPGGPAPAPAQQQADEDGPVEEGTVDDMTKAELLEEARELDIEGRSSMSKDELADAVAQARSEGDEQG